MGVSGMYNEQLRGNGNRIEGMDLVADAIWKAPNNETGLTGPYFFAMYGETPAQSTATDVHDAVNAIKAPLGQPLLIARPDHKFVPNIISKPEGVNAKNGIAYTVNREGRMRGTGKWRGIVGVHAHRLDPRGSLTASVHPLIHSVRHVGSANTQTDLRPSRYSLHIGQTAIEKAIIDTIAQVENPKRSAEELIEIFNSQTTLLRKTLHSARRRTVQHR